LKRLHLQHLAFDDIIWFAAGNQDYDSEVIDDINIPCLTGFYSAI
jgi:hypothetical protein